MNEKDSNTSFVIFNNIINKYIEKLNIINNKSKKRKSGLIQSTSTTNDIDNMKSVVSLDSIYILLNNLDKIIHYLFNNDDNNEIQCYNEIIYLLQNYWNIIGIYAIKYLMYYKNKSIDNINDIINIIKWILDNYIIEYFLTIITPLWFSLFTL